MGIRSCGYGHRVATMLRSVGELLPSRFEDLTIDHVRAIMERIGDARETLFFERKVLATRSGLAKSCAAFANTYGGLLVVGIRDDDDEMVGIEPIGEPQLWVKDILRGNMLPLPPFRARTLTLENGNVLLLVLVERSSVTPHLLTANGAIYVRAPSASEPVPLADQRLLLELTHRGAEENARAEAHAIAIARHRFAEVAPYVLTLAPTGVPSNTVRDLYRGLRSADLLTAAVDPGDRSPSFAVRTDRLRWQSSRVKLCQRVTRGINADPARIVDGIVLDEGCGLVLERGYLPDSDGEKVEPRGPRPLYVHEMVEWTIKALARGTRLLLELGAHGDLRVRVTFGTGGRHVFYADSRAEKARGDLDLAYGVPLDHNAEELRDALRADIGLALDVSYDAIG